jgi:hypothetical protein
MTPRFTATDRLTAFTELERFSTDIAELDDGVAYDEFWGEQWDKADELDETLTALSSGAFDMWFWLDRPLADGRLVVDRLLVENPTLQPGVRHYLELARETCMRLYEVIDLRPGVSVTLRDVMDDAAVAVHEKRASRQLRRADLLAARVIRCGISGQPEMEAGVLNFSPLMRESIVTQLSSHREEFRRERHGTSGIAFYKEMVPFFHCAWLIAHLDPPIPRVANTDGDDLLVTRVHFDVGEPMDLREVLDRDHHLERVEGRTEWIWSGANRSGEPVLLGRLVLAGGSLTLETNSLARGQRGQEMIEGLAGEAVAHRASSHEDPTRSLPDAVRARSCSTASWCEGTGDGRRRRGRISVCVGSRPIGRVRTSPLSSSGPTSW